MHWLFHFRTLHVEFKLAYDDIKIDWVEILFEYPTWLGTAAKYNASGVGWTSHESSDGWNRAYATAYLQDPGLIFMMNFEGLTRGRKLSFSTTPFFSANFCCQLVQVGIDTSSNKLKRYEGKYRMTTEPIADWTYKHINKGMSIYK